MTLSTLVVRTAELVGRNKQLRTRWAFVSCGHVNHELFITVTLRMRLGHPIFAKATMPLPAAKTFRDELSKLIALLESN